MTRIPSDRPAGASPGVPAGPVTSPAIPGWHSDVATPGLPVSGPPQAGRPGTSSSAPSAVPPAAEGAGQAPAGGADGKPRPPAGFHRRPRIFTIELPAGIRILSLNDRTHWRARNRHGQVIRDAAIIMARKAKVPRLERVTITAEYRPPDRRRRDPDNIAAAVKYAIDGITAAGVLRDDDKRHVASVTYVIGEPIPRGQLLLYITEVADEATAGAA